VLVKEELRTQFLKMSSTLGVNLGPCGGT
jgi:hypothetical protein